MELVECKSGIYGSERQKQKEEATESNMAYSWSFVDLEQI